MVGGKEGIEQYKNISRAESRTTCFTHRLPWQQVHGLYSVPVPEHGPAQDEFDLKPRYDAAPTDGPCALLGQGPEDRLQNNQRAGRDGGHGAGLPRGVQTPPVPGAGQRLL
jgi:hypothetical protein